jgi:hypothetical protein
LVEFLPLSYIFISKFVSAKFLITQLNNCEAIDICKQIDKDAKLVDLDDPFEHSGELYSLITKLSIV